MNKNKQEGNRTVLIFHLTFPLNSCVPEMISWMNFSVELLGEILRRADISSAGKEERGLSFECEYLNTEPPRVPYERK